MDRMTDSALCALLARRAAARADGDHATAAERGPEGATDGIVLRDDERQRCEVWTRVMGYHRPVASFNIGKKGEHHERRFFREPAADAVCGPAG